MRRLRGALSRAARELRVRAGQPPRAPIVSVPGAVRGADRGSARFDAERAWRLLEAQCAFGPRIPGSPGHARARAWLVERLAEHADEVAVQGWTQRIYRGPGAGSAPMSNLLARIEGRERGAAAELLLGAHWDTRPVADQDPDPARRTEPVPGANDGASGVAVLLEVARALAAERPRRTVLIALFDGEDLGEYYYGSRLFARWIRRREARRWRPERAVVVDMVGKRGLSCAAELHSRRAAPELWRELMAAARAAGEAHHFQGPELAINDDHVSLNRVGIPSVLLIDYAFPQWHTTHDTVEHCAAESLSAVGRVLLQLARG